MQEKLEILVVEDNEDDLYFIQKALRQSGHIWRVISNGEEAFNYLLEPDSAPDIVLLDFHLPGMSGIEIMEQLRNRSREYVFIFLTIESTIDIVIQAMQAGATDYLVKSARITSELPAKIRHAQSLAEIFSQKKKAEAALKQSLQEKDTLLKEVHHRVKNNLQIIISLLNITLPRYNNPADRALGNDFLTRVQAIALVHEELYQSDCLAEIDLAEYIIKLLPRYESVAYEYKKKIEYNLDLNKCIISIDTAIPVGLIINEIITNSIKHAFDGMDSGRIEIKLEESLKGRLLTVCDNGRGFKENHSDRDKDMLGISLVKSLAEQLSADAVWKTADGTLFTLDFRSY